MASPLRDLVIVAGEVPKEVTVSLPNGGSEVVEIDEHGPRQLFLDGTTSTYNDNSTAFSVGVHKRRMPWKELTSTEKEVQLVLVARMNRAMKERRKDVKS